MRASELDADIRYALRSLPRAPVFFSVATVTVAIGIMAMSTILSLVNGVYLKPLPLYHAESLVAIGQRDKDQYTRFGTASEAVVEAIRRSAASYERITVYRQVVTSVSRGDDARQVIALQVDSNFAPLFQMGLYLGRAMSEDDFKDRRETALLGYDFWRSQLGADSSIVGSAISLGERSFKVVGVAPERFRFPWRTDVYVTAPIALGDTSEVLNVVARLREGVTRSAAQTELEVIAARLRRDTQLKRVELVLHNEPLDRRGNQYLPRPHLFLLGTLLVLVVSWSNVANLFSVRLGERRRELAVRQALGASRSRLIGHLLAEGVVIASGGTLLGTIVSLGILRVMSTQLPKAALPAWVDFGFDLRMLSASVVIVLMTTTVIALFPAMRAAHQNVALTIAGTEPRTKGFLRTFNRARRGVVFQVGVAVLFFTTATFLGLTFFRVDNVDLGYDAGRVASIPIMGQWSSMKGGDALEHLKPIRDRVSAIPGVVSVGLKGIYAGERNSGVVSPSGAELVVDGDMGEAMPSPVIPRLLTVTDEYFAALQLDVISGRLFDSRSSGGYELVVSASFAKMLRDNHDIVGSRVRVVKNGPTYRVIGVVEDIQGLQLSSGTISVAPQVVVYFSVRNALFTQPELIARTEQDAAPLRMTIMGAIRSVNPSVVLPPSAAPFDEFAEIKLVTRVLGSLVGAFSLTTILLAVVGIYGIAAYGVTQRTKEFGIRLALGATRHDIGAMIIREQLMLVAAGLGIGLLASFAVTQVMRAVVVSTFAVSAAVMSAALVLFALIALLACYTPARRAMRLSPTIAMRAE